MGDEAASTEEGQPVRQLDAVVALPEQGGGDVDDGPAPRKADGRSSGDVTPGSRGLTSNLPRGGIEASEAVEASCSGARACP